MIITPPRRSVHEPTFTYISSSSLIKQASEIPAGYVIQIRPLVYVLGAGIP